MKSNVYNSQRISKVTKVISLIFCLLLVLSNVFEAYSASVNAYPMTSTRWTGSVTATGAISASSVMYTKGGATGTRDRAWMKIDLSGIPLNSTINAVTLKYFISAGSLSSLQFRKVTADPVTIAGSTLWTQIGSGTIYATYSNNVMGWNSRVLTTTTLKTDIQTAVSGSGNGWVAIGMYETSGSSLFETYADGWNQSNKPYLVIDYTSNLTNDISLDSISSPKNFACEGSWPVTLKVTNAGTNAINNTYISWNLNSQVMTPLTYTFTPPLAPGATTYITLTNYTFNPGNFIINATLANPNGVSDPFTANNSKTVLLQITPKPSIYLQPVDQSIGVGGDAVFSTTGAGANITYQWQVSSNGGTSFTSLTNLGPYTNVTTQNLNITAATQAMNGYLFRCVVSGTCPPAAITDTVMLSVGPPVTVKAGHANACTGVSTVVPIIVKDAINALGMKFTLTFNSLNISYISNIYTNPLLNGSFTVTPGTGKVTINWTGVSSINLPNDTICKLTFNYTNNSNLIFDTITPGNCKVTGVGGAIFPSHYFNGSLTTAAPAITNQPDNKLIIEYQQDFFRVLYTGQPTFQWQISTNNGSTWTNLANNTTYSGVTKDTLWVTPSLSMNGYKYRCILSSCSSTITSNAALMQVMKLVKTWFDTIYDCTCYSPARDILVPVKVSNFDSINSISLSFFYKNTALLWNGVNYINPALQVPTIFHSTVGGNTMVRVASFAMSGFMAIPDNGTLVEFKFKVLCDTTKLQWETWNAGACQYSTGPDTAIYVFDAEFRNGFVLDGGPNIVTSPSNQTVFAGNTTTFSCTGNTHPGSVTFQWQVSTNGGTTYSDLVNDATYSGVYNNTLTVNVSSTSMNGYKYRCKLHGFCDDQFTAAATLTVNAPPIYVTIPTVTSCQGDTIVVPVNVQNFASVCSLSLTLGFNNALMTFAGFSDLNAGIPNQGSFICNSAGSNVSMAWASLAQGTVAGTGTLVKLKFIANSLFSNSPLSWVTVPASNCQITNCSAVPVNTVYSNSTVSVNPIPVIHNIITPYPAGGHFCAGDLGAQVGVDITQVGVNYALYRNGVVVAGYNGVSGTGFGITFNTFNIPGVYTVRAFYPTTGCWVTMDGVVNITVDSPPTLYTVTGTGSFCTGGTGIPVGLSNSQLNVDYFLYRDGFPVDTLVGTGSALDFGNQILAGTYTIIGRNALYETCPTTMTGSAIITINPYPSAAGTITGPASSICQGGTGYSFTVGAIANATSYTWTVPSGCTILGGNGTSTITCSFSTSALSGVISVKGTNICGDGTPNTYNVTVNPLPVAAGIISGPNPVCQGSTNVTYTVPTITNATSYAWTFPNGFTIVSNNGNSCVVNVGLLAASGNITVTGHNSCGDGIVGTLAVVVSPMAGNAISINGTSTPCQGAIITYSTPPIANATNYIWTLPTGATGTSTTNSITVTFATNAVSGNITVTGNNSCGSGGTYTLPLTIQPLPGASGTISLGPSDVCIGSTYTYSVSPVTGALNYIWTIPGGFTGSSTTNSITVTVGASAVSGNITVVAHNNCGNGVSSAKALTVRTLPTPTLAAFTNRCIDGGNLTLSGGSPAGGTYSGTGVSGGIFNPTVSGVGTFTITYTYTDTYSCVGTATNTITVVNLPRITGAVNYDNAASTAMGNVKIRLRDAANTITIDSTLSTAIIPYGNYTFYCVAPSTNYNLACSTVRAHITNQCNATDALKILRYAVGLDTLSLFRRKASDVNLSNSINSVDALLVMKRWSAIITSFTAGDWIFNTVLTNPLAVGTSTATKNILALCVGDANGSCTPDPVNKISPSVTLEHNQTVITRSEETIEIPVLVKNQLESGAISLSINYDPAAMQIINVKSKLNGFIYNILDDQIRFGWYSLDAVKFNTNETLLTLVVKIKKHTDNEDIISMDIDNYSEFADIQANPLTKVSLDMPSVKIQAAESSKNKEFSLGANKPNPFNYITEITYSMPEEGDVKLSVINLLGEEVKVLVNNYQGAGNYTVKFDGSGYTPGMYLYKIEINGKTQHFTNSHTMIISE